MMRLPFEITLKVHKRRLAVESGSLEVLVQDIVESVLRNTFSGLGYEIEPKVLRHINDAVYSLVYKIQFSKSLPDQTTILVE